MSKFTAKEIAFADRIGREVSANLAGYVRRLFDAGHSIAEVKNEIRAAMDVVETERT
jgi:hypothetical protein